MALTLLSPATLSCPSGWDWVLASPFRAHVRRLLTAEPLPWRALAGYAGVPDNVLRGLLGLGRRPLHRIPPHCGHALFAVEATALRADLREPVAPGPALTAAEALLAAGWTVPQVAQAGLVAEARLDALLAGAELMIDRRTELCVTAAARAHGVEARHLALLG